MWSKVLIRTRPATMARLLSCLQPRMVTMRYYGTSESKERRWRNLTTMASLLSCMQLRRVIRRYYGTS